MTNVELRRCPEKGCCFRGPVCPDHGVPDESEDVEFRDVRNLMKHERHKSSLVNRMSES